SSDKRAGGQSLRLVSRGQVAGVTSAPFAAPATGRIAVEFYLRVAAGDPTLRVALEGPTSEGRYNSYGLIQPAHYKAAAGGWARYAFPLEDLPGDGLERLSLRLELISAGEALLDDVQIFDLAFSEAERVELSKLVAVAYSKLNRGQLAECSRLLEGYW